MKAAIWSLAVAAICAMTGLAFKQPAEFRAIAIWIWGIMTVGIFIFLLLCSSDLFSRSGEIFDRKGFMEYYDLQFTLGAVWLVVSVFLFCLWMLPHILPTPQSPVPPQTSATSK